ncbi:MAG: type IV secretory system conjugative DNA transfer family protein [Bacilli bacterium]
MDSIKFNAMTPIEFVILILVLFAIFFILYLEPRLNKRKLENKNEHGSSKFADMKEIEKTFVKEDLNNINSVGFPVWYEKKNGKFDSVYFDNKSPHYLLIGSTGSGKSVTVVIPECFMFATAKEKHSVVVTDPKAEIFNATSKVFKDNGYDVITIDFRNPNKSNKINIMQPIINEWKEYCHYNKIMLFLFAHLIKDNRIKIDNLDDKKYLNKIKEKYSLEDYLIDIIDNNKDDISQFISDKKMYENDFFKGDLENNMPLKEYLSSKSNEDIMLMIREYQNLSSKHQAESNRLVISLADLIFVDKETNDKFWINSAKQLFIGICGIFLEDYQNGLITENKINISSVKKFQNSSLIKENQTFLQKNVNNRKYGSLSKDYLTSILSAAENTYKSITAVFGEKMAIFDDLNVENVTSSNEFNFTDLGSKPTALYIIVPDEDRAYFQLVTIIIGMLTKDLTRFANLPENKGQLPVMVEWILDEFANCPPLNSIETLVSVARSRKMRFQFFIQSYGQLSQVYGKDVASIIQDNCALVYLKTNTVETAEIIAKKLGKATVETHSMSNSTDVMKIGANKTTSLMGKELLTATEIIALKYKTIIFPTISNPIFRDTYMYSDLFPQFKKLNGIDRETKVLKRITSNYYTVEELRKKSEIRSEKKLNQTAKNIEMQFKHNIQKEVNKITKNIENKLVDEEIIDNDFMNDLKNKLFVRYDVSINKDVDSYSMLINKIINKVELKEIEDYVKTNYSFGVSRNLSKGTTKITIWDNTKEKKI